MIPIYIITGFLGSGKTTFLQHVLLQYSGTKRMVVIQNEFASKGIDGLLLEDARFQFHLIELNGCSLFCDCLYQSLKARLFDITEKVQPDIVLVETSGIADPGRIVDVLKDSLLSHRFYLAHIWTLVDALRVEILSRVSAVVDAQIAIADTVIANKCDQVTALQEEMLGRFVKQINPFASVRYTSFSAIDLDGIFDTFICPLPVVLRETTKRLTAMPDACSALALSSSYFSTDRVVDKYRFLSFLQQLDEKTVRLKGFVRFANGEKAFVQYVAQPAQLVDSSLEKETTQLIAIGYVPIDFEELFQ